MSVNGAPYFLSGDDGEASLRKRLWNVVNNASEYPMVMEFARPLTKASSSSDLSASSSLSKSSSFFTSDCSERYSVSVPFRTDLGCAFKKTSFSKSGEGYKSIFANSIINLASSSSSSKRDDNDADEEAPPSALPKPQQPPSRRSSSNVEYMEISSLHGVSGPCATTCSSCESSSSGASSCNGFNKVYPGMKISKINSHAVPLGCPVDEAKSAIERCWREGQEVEVLFTDQRQMEWIRSLR